MGYIFKILKVLRCFRRWFSAVVAVALVAVVIQLAAPALVLAHASLVRAEPSPNSVLDQAPSQVKCWFAEAVEAGYSDIKVIDAHGIEVDNRDRQVDPRDATAMAVTLPSLPNGIYSVVWSTVSAADGHSDLGSFLFSVGEPLPSGAAAKQAQPPAFPLLAASLLKWLALISILALTGGLTFESLIWRPVLAGRRSSQGQRELAQRLSARTAKLNWWFLGAFFVASIGQLVVETMAAANLPLFKALGSPMVSLLTGTDWGHWWIWRMLFAASMAFFLDFPPEWRNGESGRWRYRLGFGLPLVCGAGVLLTLSFVSHASGVAEAQIWAVTADFLHLAAAAAWIGGLFQLALSLPAFKRSLDPEEGRSSLAALLPRFSAMAIASVVILIFTGTFGAVSIVKTAQDWFSPYGLTLLTKILLMLALLTLGASNLTLVSPLLKKDRSGVTWLSRAVGAEVAMAVVLLLVVGVLTNMQPPQQPTAQASQTQTSAHQFDSTADGVQVTIDIAPAKLGPNNANVNLSDARTGAFITNASLVSLKFKSLAMDMGESAAYLQPAGGGNYVAQNIDLNIAGDWQGELLVTRPDAFDLNLSFQFSVRHN
jgi:copper transport protein